MLENCLLSADIHCDGRVQGAVDKDYHITALNIEKMDEVIL